MVMIMIMVVMAIMVMMRIIMVKLMAQVTQGLRGAKMTFQSPGKGFLP